MNEAIHRREFLADAAGALTAAVLSLSVKEKKEDTAKGEGKEKGAGRERGNTKQKGKAKSQGAGKEKEKEKEKDGVPCKAATSGPRHHFFGYYDKCPWDRSGRYLLACEADFAGRQPKPGEELALGIVDLSARRHFRPFAATSAWCWQQGCMLRWLPTKEDRFVIYNVRDGEKWGSVVHDVLGGGKRSIPFPVYDVTPDGTRAVSLNFSRLAWTRPGYGYEGIPDPWRSAAAPAEDGVYAVDLEKGESRLIVSLERLALFQPRPDFSGARHWVNHLLFNPTGGRFIFLHRWAQPEGGWSTRLFTADPEGQDLRLLLDHDLVSHFIWRDPTTILVYARHPSAGDGFYLVDDGTGKARPVGRGVVAGDGHCSYSPDGRWILLDTYPDKDRLQHLFLLGAEDGRKTPLGSFLLPAEFQGSWRCDLHPRWSRDGKSICIDSAHEGTRQMYLLDVGEYTG